jgi:hypothetical protein
MEGSFRDSTLRLSALGLAPNRSFRVIRRRAGALRERYTVSVDSLEARGVDWGEALRVGAVPARSVILDGLDLLIFTDKRIPGRPIPRPRIPILQETLARFGRPIAIDSLRIRGGRVRYQVQPETGEKIGKVEFGRIDGRLTGLHWDPDSGSSSVAVLSLRATLWGVAPMALTLRGPLGSPLPGWTSREGSSIRSWRGCGSGGTGAWGRCAPTITTSRSG